MRWLVRSVVAVVFALAPAQASAAITSVLAGHTISGNGIPCAAQTDGVRVCHGTDGGGGPSDLRFKSFDNAPLEIYVILPPAPVSGSDGGYPLVFQSHGWGGSAGGPNDTEFYGPTADSLAKDGYAVVQLTARGFGDSCGKATSPGGMTACANGYIRLDDERYEVRDIQTVAGVLVDAGIADHARIGATGESYGGGVSLELASLRDRVMYPDGSLHPWKSPNGTPLRLAAAAPVIPWSDLVYSLTPNGRTLDYRVTSPSDDLKPIGVEKQSFVSGLFALGLATGFYSTTDPQANLPAWYALINAGEPYESNPQAQFVLDQIARYHSAYYVLDGAYGRAKEPPAPLLIANGFTDDLFPVDEAVRYYNLDRSLYPSDPISLFDGDFGHQPAQNKPGDRALLLAAIQRFLDHYVKGTGSQPTLGATAMIETCPSTAPSLGPYSAPSWAALHPGEVDYSSDKAQTITSAAGDPTISAKIDPITGGGACATAPAADQGAGVATYRLPAVTGKGYTLLGSPTVSARLTVTGQFAFIASRLWDVDPASGQETLVARGIYRIDAAAPNGRQVFQLHPGAWHFAAGHIPKLELLGNDSPYARTSNGQFQITVSGLELRLPVHERPGSVPAVGNPQPPFGGCVARPFSKINRHRTHQTSDGLVAAGTAGEHQCAHAAASERRRQRVKHVFVSIYTKDKRGRCHFLRANGSVSGARSCRDRIELRATGTTQWRLRLRMQIPSGHYFVRSDAVDGFGRHQRPSSSSVVVITIQ